MPTRNSTLDDPPSFSGQILRALDRSGWSQDTVRESDCAKSRVEETCRSCQFLGCVCQISCLHALQGIDLVEHRLRDQCSLLASRRVATQFGGNQLMRRMISTELITHMGSLSRSEPNDSGEYDGRQHRDMGPRTYANYFPGQDFSPLFPLGGILSVELTFDRNADYELFVWYREG